MFCDAPNPPIYLDMVVPGDLEASASCRCVICGRCGKHTGNTSLGHFWSYCQVTHKMRREHFCCPDGCELDQPQETAA